MLEKTHIIVNFPEHTHLHIHMEVCGLDEVLNLLKELKTMSQTNQEKIDAANALFATTLDGIQSDIADIADDLQKAIPVPGTVPTQESLDALNANVAKLTAMKDALDALKDLNPGQTPTPSEPIA